MGGTLVGNSAYQARFPMQTCHQPQYAEHQSPRISRLHHVQHHRVFVLYILSRRAILTRLVRSSCRDNVRRLTRTLEETNASKEFWDKKTCVTSWHTDFRNGEGPTWVAWMGPPSNPMKDGTSEAPNRGALMRRAAAVCKLNANRLYTRKPSSIPKIDAEKYPVLIKMSTEGGATKSHLTSTRGRHPAPQRQASRRESCRRCDTQTHAKAPPHPRPPKTPEKGNAP